MGCWNKTCGLSNLPILHGERTYVFVMEQVNSVGDHCYSTHLYRPVLLPFESTYNDYGGGEDSSGVGFDLIMAGLKKSLIEMPVGENPYHDIAVTKDAFDEELFFESVHERRLKTTDDYGKPQNIEFTMFRKDIVDAILDTYVIEDYVGPDKGTTGYKNSYVTYKFADLIADIPMLISALKDRYAGRYDMMGMGSIVVPSTIDTHLRVWLRNNESYRFSSLIYINELLVDMLEAGDDQRAVELLTEHLKAIFVNNFMEITRKSWMPQCGEGSQYQDPAPYRVLMAAMDYMLKQIEKDEDDE